MITPPALKKAHHHYTIASHFLNVTFPLTKDPKIFLGVIENLHLSHRATMEVLHSLHHQTASPKEKALPQALFNNETLLRKHSLSQHLELISRFKSLSESHRKSPVEFHRDERYVICDEEYLLKIISAQNLRQDLLATKEFITKVEQLLLKE